MRLSSSYPKTGTVRWPRETLQPDLEHIVQDRIAEQRVGRSGMVNDRIAVGDRVSSRWRGVDQLGVRTDSTHVDR